MKLNRFAVFILGCILLFMIYASHSHDVQERFQSQTFYSRPPHRGTNTCREAINIAFVKVHKAGSTTLQNILLRFGHRRNLTFVLSNMSDTRKPASYRHYLGWEDTIDFPSLLPLPQGKTNFNILASHVVYNKLAFQKIMPNNTVYIGIVREPLKQLISTFAFYGYGNNWKTNKNDSVLTHYLKYPEKYKSSYLNARMSFDFGLRHMDNTNETVISEFIRDLDQTFSLVIILEYFDESLVLLKRKLCWNIRDIIYITKNKSVRMIDYTFDDVQKHKALALADYRLYSHFYFKFWSEVREELSIGFAEEVRYFKNVLRKVQMYCDIPSRTSDLVFGHSKWSDPFTLSKDDCTLMNKHEVAFLTMLVRKQARLS